MKKNKRTNNEPKEAFIYFIVFITIIIVTTSLLESRILAIKSESKELPVFFTEEEIAREYTNIEKEHIAIEKEFVQRIEQESETKYVESVVPNENVVYYNEQDIVDVAKVLYGECRGCKSLTEQACVVWTILNRTEDGFSISEIVRMPNRYAYNEEFPVWDKLYDLAFDVLERWSQEKNGVQEVGRVLPREYKWFNGYNGHNWFRNSYNNGDIWDYSLPSPYET